MLTAMLCGLYGASLRIPWEWEWVGSGGVGGWADLPGVGREAGKMGSKTLLGRENLSLMANMAAAT